MTELLLTDPETTCPVWCVHDGEPTEHDHVSADVVAGLDDQPLTARLVQMDQSGEPRVLVNGRVADLGGLATFVRGLQRLLGQAHLAPAGLGFVGELMDRSGLTATEVAGAAGLDVAWVRAQHAGRQMLTVNEFEQLALAVVALTAEAPTAR